MESVTEFENTTPLEEFVRTTIESALAGLPEGFHRAAAELYRRLAVYKDAQEPPLLEEVTRALLGPRGSDGPD